MKTAAMEARAMNDAIQSDVGLTDAIFHRRSVRRYSDRNVNPDTVRRLLDAAVQAPSALNQQPWVFGVFHGRKRLLEYSERAKRHLVATYPTTFELHSRSELYESADYQAHLRVDGSIGIFACRREIRPRLTGRGYQMRFRSRAH